MRRAIVVLIIVMAILLPSGCAVRDPHFHQRDLDVTHQRVYAGVTPDRILEASELLFALAGGYGVTTNRQDHSVGASRHLNLGMSSWSEEWQIETQPTFFGVRVTVGTHQDNNGIITVPHTVGPYELFFTRLDYLLGQADTWTTCDQYSRAYEAYTIWHYDGYLCLFADDKSPTGPLTLARGPLKGDLQHEPK